MAGTDSSRVRIVQRDRDQPGMGVECSASSSLALKTVCDGCTESRVGLGTSSSWLNRFNAELPPKRYWRGPSFQISKKRETIPTATLSLPK